MTPDEREQVVELLRCAADLDVDLGTAALILLGEPLSDEGPVTNAAIAARWKAGRSEHAPEYDYHWTLLEAAQRVEEGSWP